MAELAITFAEPATPPSLSPLPSPPRLHQSTAHTLLTRSPLHAWQAHHELGDEPRTATDAMERGTLIDRLLFSGGQDVVSVDANDWRTKAAQEERLAARAVGKVAVLRKQLEEARAFVAVLRTKLVGFGFDPSEGDTQVTLDWASPNGGVLCRGTLDKLVIEKARIWDFKTTDNASPARLGKHMVDYGYDIQHAAYVEAVETLHPDMAGRVRMAFVFAECEPPYAVVPVELSGELRRLGELRWRTACRRWAECLETGIWPAYTSHVIQVDAPPWALEAAMAQGGIA